MSELSSQLRRASSHATEMSSTALDGLLVNAADRITELEAELAGRSPVSVLHPSGRCRCQGEGTCLWCQRIEWQEKAEALAQKVADAEWLFDKRWLPLKCKIPEDSYTIECRAQTIKALLPGSLWEVIRAAREEIKDADS